LAAHLYTEDDFSKHCVFHGPDVMAASGGKPALWVHLELHPNELDIKLIETILQRYGLKVYQELEDDGFWDGTWKP
jgi:hypothetical protein